MTWVAHLVETMTGRLGAELKISSQGSWEAPLGEIEHFTFTTGRKQLRDMDRERWFPWRSSALVSWKNIDGELNPWLLGPITDFPREDRGDDTATFTCRGIGELLRRRILMERDFGAQRITVAEMGALAESEVHLEGYSYGAMMQEIVRLCTEERMGGQLPIHFGSAREVGSDLFVMSYYGYNLANNDAWKLITERSNLVKGPDFAFRPRFDPNDPNRVEWSLVHGTVAQRSIAQDWTMDLDTSSTETPLSDLNPISDSMGMYNKAWWTGAGEDAGTLIRSGVNLDHLSGGMPLMEFAGSDSDSDNPRLLDGRIETLLWNGSAPLQQLTAEIDGADPRAEIGRWHVGDYANLTIGDDWLTVPSTGGKSRPYKIIAAKGGWHQKVTLEFQEVLV